MTEPTESSAAARRWWLSRGNGAEGPYSEAYVLASLQARTITAATLICPVGGNEWRPLAECPLFTEAARSADTVAPATSPSPPPSVAQTLPFSQGRLLVNPRLPRMAKWICVYCLGVQPALMILGLPWTFEGAASAGTASSAFGLLLLWDLVVLVLDIATTVLLFVSGLRLRQLKPSARWWATVSLYVSLGWDALALLGSLFVQVVAAALDPRANAASDNTSLSAALVYLIFGLVLVAVAVACTVFKIVAVVWLHRHGDTLPAAHT